MSQTLNLTRDQITRALEHMFLSEINEKARVAVAQKGGVEEDFDTAKPGFAERLQEAQSQEARLYVVPALAYLTANKLQRGQTGPFFEDGDHNDPDLVSALYEYYYNRLPAEEATVEEVGRHVKKAQLSLAGAIEAFKQGGLAKDMEDIRDFLLAVQSDLSKGGALPSSDEDGDDWYESVLKREVDPRQWKKWIIGMDLDEDPMVLFKKALPLIVPDTDFTAEQINEMVSEMSEEDLSEIKKMLRRGFAVLQAHVDQRVKEIWG